MKTKYLILTAALALAATLSSCSEDWLAVESHDSLSIDEYYTSEARIYEALIAAYSPMHYFDFNGSQYCSLPVIYGVMGDDIYPGGESSTDNNHFQLAFNYISLPTDTPSGAWEVAYEGINRSNAVFQYMPGVLNISNANKELYLAEAAVLRTYYYNVVWKLFGNVPYYEVNLQPPYIQAQNTANEVYDLMMAALEPVTESDVLPMRVADAETTGRISWAMAAMLYTEIVMYQNDETRFGKALGYMKRIIDSGQYGLLADYGEIFEEAAEWSSESIFEVNYMSDGSIRAFTGGEKQPGGTIYPHTISPDGLTNGGKFGPGGWGTGPVTPMAANMFPAGDKRKAASVYEPEAEGASFNREARYQTTGYFLAKYISRSDGRVGNAGAAEFGNNNNLRIYRYSETLLNAAELILRGAGTGDAQGYLDQVRTRAGLASVPVSEESLLAERRLEFMGEGKRYWDLVRTGMAATVLTPGNDTGGWRKNSWTPSKKYLPIPQSEIDAAKGTLTQNQY